MSIKSRWINRAAMTRVTLAFESLGYHAPRTDDGSNGAGAYASNIAGQYCGSLSEREAMAIIRYGLAASRDAIAARWQSEREIVERYAE